MKKLEIICRPQQKDASLRWEDREWLAVLGSDATQVNCFLHPISCSSLTSPPISLFSCLYACVPLCEVACGT